MTAPVFSPDSAHVAYPAQRDDRKCLTVVECGVGNGEGARVEVRIR